MLTGGSGYVVGTLFGVMVLAVTQALIQFIGSLSSWWTKIVIGVLTLIFIGVQTGLATRKDDQKMAQDPQALEAEKIRRRKQAFVWGGFVVLVLAAFIFIPRITGSNTTETVVAEVCDVPPYREEEAASLIADGAVIVYNRTAGPQCVDELFAIYPDGRIIGNDGVNKVEKQVPPADVEQLLLTISEDYGWFTDDIYNTYHNPCRQCFTHYVIASYDGQEKAVTGVDGGTDMPPGYGLTLAIIRPALPVINPAP